MMPRHELVTGSWICWGSGWFHNFPFINSCWLKRKNNLFFSLIINQYSIARLLQCKYHSCVFLVSFSPCFVICRDLFRTSEEQGCTGWACRVTLWRVWNWKTSPTNAGKFWSRDPLGAHKSTAESELTPCGHEAFALWSALKSIT